MRMTVFLTLVTFLQVSASISNAQRITLNEKNVRLDKVFDDIRRQTSYNFLYNADDVKDAQNVTLNIKDATIVQVLNLCFKGQPLEYTISGNTIGVKRKEIPAETKATGTTAVLIDVNGTVNDEQNNALPGAGISIKGKTGITQTDKNGKFILHNVPADAVLVISFIGYTTQEVPVKNQTTVIITLIPAPKSLNEVVVIGYGAVKKKDLTGSVVNVNMADIKDEPVLSADLALQGRVPGADIMASTGEPGAPASIRIRGTRSISATNEPLIVVDGVLDAVSNLSDVNTADIESISVLKDASATAIYGSRGSNGVVIITTKQGQKGKDAITFKTAEGISQLPRELDLMNASEFAQYRDDYAYFATSDNYNITPQSPLSDYPYPDPLSMGKGTDWVKEITRVAPFTNSVLSLSGGGAKTNYYASIAYDNDQGIIQKSGLKRITGRLNLDYQLFPWMKVGYKFNRTAQDADLNLVTIGGTNWWNAAIYLSPLIKVQDNFNDLWGSGQKFNSPRAVLDYDVIKNTKRDGTTHTGYMEIQPVKNLKINSQATLYTYQTHTFNYEPGSLPAKSPDQGGTAYRAETNQTNFMSQTTATYARRWNDSHSMDLMAGFIGQHIVTNSLSAQGSGYQTDAITWNNMNAIPSKENYVVTSGNTQQTSMSVIGRANYNYRERYYLTVTGRRDGASNFAADKKWAFFPSAALKWNISNENFMKKYTWVNDLSLRLSAGRTGNDGIAAYRSLSALASTTNGYLFNGTQPVAYYPSRLASEDLSWEKTDMYNAATDISLFNNRVNITLEAYLSYTSDLLLDVQTPTQTGYTTRFANVGKTSNKGIELSISTRNITKPKFSWSTDFTISHNEQMVNDIGTANYVNVYGAYGNNSYMMYGYEKDYPLNALWGFQYAGTWKSQAEIDRNKITKAYVSATNAQYVPGSPRYIDTNHDGVFNEKDILYLGNSDPYVYGGVQNTFRFGKLSVSTFIAYSWGGEIYNISEQWMGNGTNNTNQYRYMLGAWNPVRNPNSDIPRAGSGDAIASDRMVHDASYLRLKTVTIAYTWDMKRLTNNWVKDAQFALSGENLYLLQHYNGFDPDVSSESGTSTLRRVDIGAYPKPRTIVASLQLRY